MTTTKASAVWTGTLKEGKGTMKLPKGNFEGPFTYASRFESGDETNPEELIGAALAGCYSMFLSALLSKEHNPERVETTATVKMGEGPAIKKIVLDCSARVPGLSEDEFQEFAQKAKVGCPVSKALKGVDEIVLNASLQNG